MKKVVLSVTNPNTEVSINELQGSGHKFIGLHQPNEVMGLVGRSEGGLVIYNMESIETSNVLSPHTPNEEPTVEYGSVKELNHG